MFAVVWDREFLEGNLKGVIYRGSRCTFPNLWDAETFMNDLKAMKVDAKKVRYFNFRIELVEQQSQRIAV